MLHQYNVDSGNHGLYLMTSGEHDIGKREAKEVRTAGECDTLVDAGA
jgi:hypothetical protein